MYKGKKYNAIIILLIFLISAVVGISAGMTSNPDSFNPLPPLPDINQEVEMPTGVKPPSSSARPRTRLTFAIDMMNKGKGYKSETNQTLTVKTLDVKQSMHFEKHRGGGLSLAEEWYKPPDGMLSSFGKNEYKAVFNDGTTMHEKIVKDTSKYNFENSQIDYLAKGDIKTFLTADYLGAQNRMPLNNFFFELDEKSAPDENIKSPKTPGKSYYEIIVDVNVGAIPSRYLSAFSVNGGGGTKIKKLVLTFHINKKTGMLMKVVKDELFSTTYSGLGTHDCTTELTEIFYAMNSSQESVIKERVNKSFGLAL